ncbi:phosphoglycerate kinase [candidate division WWE3 bacterium]|jgi:phosphoglycerate kinase|nr:phosphoglycerate kinase [candidate division WWE3 bacterium]MBT7350349.1 phosphoglycerate kinase [candidate division WWE3 bacterium]
MKSIKSANITDGLRILVRCDLDVPLEDGRIQDTFRLDHVLPTLKYIVEAGGFPIIFGHLGRPKGEVKPELSSSHLKPYFDKHLGEDKYELLENLRFGSRERSNDASYAKELAKMAEMYVNESFGNSHREHTSIVGVPKLLPSFAGIRLMEEVEVLSKVLKNPDKPLIAIVGGAKIETKRPVLEKFAEIADEVLVGGRIGIDMDAPLRGHMHLPIDYAEDQLDIGLKSCALFEKTILKAKTIVWSGPMGKFEDEKFALGTKKVAEAVVASKAHSIVGGGDILAALRAVGLLDKMSFVSTGGGAMLEFLVKGNLPGLEVLGYDG